MSPQKTIIALLVVLLFLFGCSKQQTAQTPKKVTETPPATTQISGADLYGKNCAGCHGAKGVGGSAPELNTDEWKNNSNEIQNIVKNGREGMPAFSGKLNDDQIEAIGDYVASLKK